MSKAPCTIEAAKNYIQRGWMVVPIPARTKRPVAKGWPDLRIAEGDVGQFFNPNDNIGVILGEPSGWLVDVDLDCEEACELADQYLPATKAITGRPSAPRSHLWYITQGAKTEKHTDPESGAMIVELRSTGGQTVVGPSVHPEGEHYEVLDGEPANVPAPMLAACVKSLAEAVVEKRHGDIKRSPPVTTPGPRFECDGDIERRAIAYLDAMPPAISGSGGHSACYTAATTLVHGFALPPERALAILEQHYNPRCDPPWSIKELQHKVDDAANKQHERPCGWLRESNNEIQQTPVDISAITSRPIAESNSHKPKKPAIEDPGPFPEHLMRVPGFISEVMDYNLATATRQQPLLALPGAIALQAVLAARKVRDIRGNRTNLYLVSVADSGAGKEHARKVCRKTLYSAGLEFLEGNDEIASDAGLLSAVEPEPGCLFQIDEFGRFLRTIGDPKRSPHLFNVLTTMMKLYSCADTTFRGKAYSDAKRNRIIDQPCVVLHGTSVPGHFYESLTVDSMEDGFVARILVFESHELPMRQRVPEQPPPASIAEAARWWGEFEPGGNLRREHPEPVLVPTTDEAGQIFDKFSLRVDQRMRNKKLNGAALWARAEEKACRLALVYACSVDRENPIIDGEATRWACELTEYLTFRVLFLAQQWISDGHFDARQKKVLRIIRTMGGEIDRSDFSRKTQWLSKRERDDVIDNLLETGQLVKRDVPSRTKTKVIYVIP